MRTHLETRPTGLRELPVDAPERRRLPVLLRRAWFSLNQAFRRRLAPLALTPDQFTVLRTVLERPGITQRQLALQIASDPNTIAALLERMADSSLVERQPHPTDRRAFQVFVTGVGRRKYLKARSVAILLQQQVLESVPAQRRERFLADLEQLGDACLTAAANGHGGLARTVPSQIRPPNDSSRL